MGNIIKIAVSAMLALGCAYIAKSQACPGVGNNIGESYKTTSSALGTRNTVLAPNSTTMGTSNNVQGDNSIGMGLRNTVKGNNSIAAGSDNAAYGRGSISMGIGNTAFLEQYNNDDYAAFAFGKNNQSISKWTFAIGDNNMSDGTYSFTVGSRNQSHGSHSYAIGCDNTNTVLAFGSVALGTNISNNAQNSVTIGSHLVNNTGGIMMGLNSLNSDKPTLFISKTTQSGKTGKVGIGNVTNPQAKLHIKADNGENAEILLDGANPSLYFNNKDVYISTTTNNMDFKAVRYNFQDGKISLGYIYGNLPKANIHIFGMKGEDANIYIQPTDNAKNAEILFRSTSNKISVGSDNVMGFTAGSYVFNNGNVSIGTTRNDGYKLAVKGVIRAEEVVVEMMKDWPDYVFSDDYQLSSIDEVKKYIDDNGHLPGIPSAEQVSEDGVKLGEINTKLLEKIEELTIYIIQQEERIKALESKLDSRTQN